MLSSYVLSSSDLRAATQRSLHASGYRAVRVGPLNGKALVIEHPSEDCDRLDSLMRSLDPGAQRFKRTKPVGPTVPAPKPHVVGETAWRSVWW
jgi:hypothetical protein